MKPTLYTIGLDLGDKSHAYCVLDASGNIINEDKTANTREALSVLSKQYPEAVIVMETGTHSPWISWHLEALGHTVHVANARKLRAISTSMTKNDRDDARMLARLGRADVTLLAPIHHRSETGQRALIPLKVRETLVRSRVSQINATRFLLKSLGQQTPSSVSATAFVKKLRAIINKTLCAMVEPLLQSIDALNAQIRQLDAQLEHTCHDEYPQAERLQQVPGVGPITALCFVLTVESPQRFADTRAIGPYLGLVPRRDQSGQTDKQLPITKAGNAHLRRLLVNCSHYILGPFGPPSHLRACGERIAARGGKSAKKRAVIAVARKLAVTLLALWKNNKDYNDHFPSGINPAATAI